MAFFKKFKLHWQILIALILAIIYGISFPTKYAIDDNTIEKLEKKKVNIQVIQKLQSSSYKIYKTQAGFQEFVESKLNEKELEKYDGKILKAAYKNDAVKAVSWMGDIFLRPLR